MAYDGPEIDTLYDSISRIGQPNFDKAKLSRPPVKIVLEIIKMIHEYTGGKFPAVAEAITDFTAEQKQERLDYIANVIQLVQQDAVAPFACEAKDITGGKEVYNTLNMLLVAIDTASKLVSKASAVQEPQYPQEEIHDEIVDRAADREQVAEVLQYEPDADDVSDELTQHLAQRLQRLLQIDVYAKQLQRPPVKLLQEIFTSFNVATNGQFPPEELTVRTEFSKEQKEERQNYIENIIECVKNFSNENLSVQSKGITSGKAVGHTLYMLVVMCRVCERIMGGESIEVQHPQQPEQQEQEKEYAEEYNNFFGQIDVPAADIFKQDAPEPAAEYPAIEYPKVQKVQELDHRYAEKIRQVDEEEQQRQYLEAYRKQAELEEEQKRRLTNAFYEVKANEKAYFNRPPPSQQRKRQDLAVKAENVVVYKRIIEDSDSEEEQNKNLQEAELPNSNFFGAAVTNQAGGAFSQDILNTQKEYERLLDDKQPAGKAVNYTNQKLLNAIQDSIRRIIPFSKATSFLEEHLVRMRQDLTVADDESVIEEQKLQKAVSLDLKSRSVVDAKVRSVGDQLEYVRANFNELVQQGLML